MADIGHTIGHVKDSEYFEVPKFLVPSGKIEIPQPFAGDQPLMTFDWAPKWMEIAPLDLRITKFMVVETVAALIVAILFIYLGLRIRSGSPPRGRLWNAFEAMLVYIRDAVARPAIGHHDADKFLPFLWTMFFFVLFCNLFGMLPWSGTATGALATTGALAVIAFLVLSFAGMSKLGPAKFWTSMVPHMDLPVWLSPLKGMIFLLELVGLFIRHFVLAVRLLANMFAGHLVLAVILGFIAEAAIVQSWLWYGVMPASVFGAVALSLLELMVAFIQAYIFTFLSALFIGMALHPH
ncbi:MAG: F0F1 ATP synthase subunit A [Planctomycetaceae bacterium]|nr:F0F1 ATP synthase subunit A [Planctomycetaceae bacterium]